jgi:hypothetical protein
MSPTIDKFDEGLRSLNIGSRYPQAESGAFGRLFETVEPVAHEIREQLVTEVETSKGIPEIFSGVNNDSSFNAVAAPCGRIRNVLCANASTGSCRAPAREMSALLPGHYTPA